MKPVKDTFGEQKPTVFLETAEALCINISRKASEIIIDANQKVADRIAIPLIARALTDFRTKDKNISHEAWSEKFEMVLNRLWIEA
jgi:hypothetical protein